MKDGNVWVPFSFIDSNSLEQALRVHSRGTGIEVVATNGGRYDVDLEQRLRHAIYWEEKVSVVRRCMWFYKGAGEAKLVPYPEDLSARLEVLYTVGLRLFELTGSVYLAEFVLCGSSCFLFTGRVCRSC